MTYLSLFKVIFGLEAVTESQAECSGVDFSFFVLECGDEIGAILNAEINGLVLEANAHLPSHLEAIPSVVAAIHIILAEYAQPVTASVEVIFVKYIRRKI